MDDVKLRRSMLVEDVVQTFLDLRAQLRGEALASGDGITVEDVDVLAVAKDIVIHADWITSRDQPRGWQWMMDDDMGGS